MKHDSSAFNVKLFDFFSNVVYNVQGNPGNDDVESELTFDATSTPVLMNNNWVSVDVPLTAFTALTTRAHLAQMILTANNNTVYVDNIYFHK